MFKWLTNRMIDNFIKEKIEEIKEVDIKNKVKKYVGIYKKDIIENIKQEFEKAIKQFIEEIAKEL